MPKSDWYAYQRLGHKYGTKEKQPISEQDFEEVMALLRKPPVKNGKDNMNVAMHFATFSGILCGVTMTDTQKKDVRLFMQETCQKPDTSQNYLKTFVFIAMTSMKDDSLVQEALPFVDSKNVTTRQAARHYLKTVGYKI